MIVRDRTSRIVALLLLVTPLVGIASSGDPQIKTDHPYYPGELSCSTFERLFKTQAELYERTTGRSVGSDEDKALASWYWRNLHYAHGEEGKGDYFDQGFAKAEWNREYWTGLFAHGFGLCGTTHAQYTVEMNRLLGQCRGRCAGVSGHNSFEVFLSGGAYGAGRWALLDHDISTVIFTPDGSRLMGIGEIIPEVKTLAKASYKPERQRGWRVSGLYDDDAVGVYTELRTVEYLAGYAGPGPMVHLRSGEALRRYLKPGLEDGKTFVFWGMNYKADKIPGPERSRTWVNQPEKMYNSRNGTGYKAGQVRFGNAVYTYRPDFAGDSYKEGVVSESNESVTFEFYTPYVIAATPASDKPWGIYDAGATNGLVVTGKASCPVSVSTDQGKTYSQPLALAADRPLDLTDLVKGHQQYFLRFHASATALREGAVSWRTVCQCNPAIIPRLKDGVNRITFLSTGRAVVSAGPNKDQAEAHVVEGKIGSQSVTLELTSPRGQKPVHLYAASWNASGNPPAQASYSIDYSADGGRSWKAVVKDWTIIRRNPEPGDFWSQSFTFGDAPIGGTAGAARVRFSNTGGRSYRKVEAHLVYEVERPSPTTVTFAWRESNGPVQTASRIYPAGQGIEDNSWQLTVGRDVQTAWVEYAAR